MNYLGRIIACCSMSIVSRTCGGVVSTLRLQSEGLQVQVLAGGGYGFRVGVKFYF